MSRQQLELFICAVGHKSRCSAYEMLMPCPKAHLCKHGEGGQAQDDQTSTLEGLLVNLQSRAYEDGCQSPQPELGLPGGRQIVHRICRPNEGFISRALLTHVHTIQEVCVSHTLYIHLTIFATL